MMLEKLSVIFLFLIVSLDFALCGFDSDGDGLPDDTDRDDDNDGIIDVYDNDDDGDGIIDRFDDYHPGQNPYGNMKKKEDY